MCQESLSSEHKKRSFKINLNLNQRETSTRLL